MPRDVNQNPEQIARDRIDDRLRASGWEVQDRDTLDFNAGPGIAVREYPTDTGPADYVLFCDRKAAGVVEANLARAEALRCSILKQAFSGKLVPQEPAGVLLQRIRAKNASQSRKRRRPGARRR